jgi:hypothetical protein
VNKKPQKPIAKAKTGLSFNGVTDYLQLPSMTMDSVEIECLIDSYIHTALLDARTGYANSDVYLDTNLSSSTWNVFINNNQISSLSSTIGQRTKVKFVSKSGAFTDDVTIFANYVGGFKTKGTLYKVTCYLNGNIVAQYDFENMRNIVGNQVIPNAVNLIPSFEDARWSIHANAKVLGRDVLHLDATGINQATRIEIPVLPNKQYKFDITSNELMRVGKSDGTTSGGYLGSISGSNKTTTTFTTDSSTTSVIISLQNGSVPTGSFDFVRPQLYQLTGQEGTLNGAPQQQNKHAKRRLYAKR